MTAPTPHLDDGLRAQLAAMGLDADQAEHQLQRLASGPPHQPLDRPCTPGDGVLVWDEAQRQTVEALGQAAFAEGRVGHFVPASGAATRLAKDLLAAWNSQDAPLSDAAERLVHGAHQLAMWPALQRSGAQQGDVRSILRALVGPDGLGLQHLPKALVPFHSAQGVLVSVADAVQGGATALHEQLAEAVDLLGGPHGRTHPVRMTFTAAPAHLEAMQHVLARAVRDIQAASQVTIVTQLTTQDPGTDTVALAEDGCVFRTADGQPLRRPGGHGALISNLAALAQQSGTDVLLVKNIDNVVPSPVRAPLLAWRRAIVGMLVQLQARAHALVRALRHDASDTEALQDAAAFVRHHLGVNVSDTSAAPLIDRLDRPWRVAGMVPVQGEPGGGPFWVGPEGEATVQIVEGAQLVGEQVQMAASGTHFNPVDMALGVLDASGKPFDLHRFVDPDAVLVVRKSHGGEPLTALEHPGLWNGAMAGWNTVFVEVPAATFNPVKTLADLLRGGRVHPKE